MAHISIMLLCTFRSLSFSSVEATSFHSLFTLSFHSSVHIPYTCELYQRGYICRPPFRVGSLIFLQVVFLYRWRALKEPRGDSWLRKPTALGGAGGHLPWSSMHGRVMICQQPAHDGG